ncbi:MAG: hypothetical protein Kow00120_20540 [Anaerolineae bacterium]
MAREYRIDRPPAVNVLRLDEELRAAFGGGAVYLGLALDPGGVRVVLDDAATETDEATARSVTLAHDHTRLSAGQAQEAARAARVAAARAQVNAADLAGIVADVGNAATVQALRAQVASLARLLGRVAEAEGYTPSVE